MPWADSVNGSFELLGGFFILTSIIRLHRDKKVHGISMFHVLFFWCWGVWNCWFYPHLGQTLSFYGGILILVANTIWLAQVLYWRHHARTEQRRQRVP